MSKPVKYQPRKKYLPKVTKEEFEKMTSEQKLLALAKDALAQVEMNIVELKKGSWLKLDITDSSQTGKSWSKAIAKFDKYKQINDLQSVFLSGKQDNLFKSCQACALGASLISYARICDDIPLQSDYSGPTIKNLVDNVSKDLLLVEAAFEMGEGYARYDTWKKKIRFGSDYYGDFELDFEYSTEESIDYAIDFGKEYIQPRDRFIAIMNNIIENGGRFKPWKK